MSRSKAERELDDVSPVAIVFAAGNLRCVMHMGETAGSNDHAPPSLHNSPFHDSRLGLGLERVLSLRSGAFVRLRFLGVVRPLCVGRSPSSVRRPGRVRFARRRAASRQNCIAEADVHVPRDDEPVRRLRRPSGRKEAEGVLFRLHGDGFPNSRARTACASSRLLDRRRVRRRRRVCRGAAHIPRHRNETRKPRAHSRRRPQRLNPLGGGHAPKNTRGRKRPRRSLPG